jgi:CRISPR-associated protein Csx10
VKANLSADQLLELEATGLGERRAEGFGRIAINLDVPPEMDWDPFELDLRPSPVGVLSKDHPLAQGMMKRLLRRDLDEQVLRCARSATQHYVGGIPNSQLSRWRVIVRDALEKKDLPRLKKFAEESKGKPGWKKMERARISFQGDRPRLTEWIEALLEKPEILNQSWEKDFVSERKLGDNSISVDPDLNSEYRLRLLDAVLAIMSKKSGGNNGN